MHTYTWSFVPELQDEPSKHITAAFRLEPLAELTYLAQALLERDPHKLVLRERAVTSSQACNLRISTAIQIRPFGTHLRVGLYRCCGCWASACFRPKAQIQHFTHPASDTRNHAQATNIARLFPSIHCTVIRQLNLSSDLSLYVS